MKSLNYLVQNFIYNGFCVDNQEGITDYTAQFKSWTDDPGIINAICSDGIERLIPTCCLIGVCKGDLPEQPKSGVLFGTPSQS